jgi:demethylmenaquinone methyltransferase/2-methoxy-6-polyprenyl-1,4-benzoquinol methylase
MEIHKENPELVRGLFSDIAGRYQAVNHLLSGGLDFYWRAIAVRLIRAWNPSTVLDVATGTGDLAMTIRSACPQARVVGADFCAPMLEVARKNGLPELVVADGMSLPFANQNFDVVTAASATWPPGRRASPKWPVS